MYEVEISIRLIGDQGWVKKFKFRLQSILDARAKALEDRQVEFGIIQMNLRKQLMHLENLQFSKCRTGENLEKLISQGESIDFTLINTHKNYIEKLQNDIKTQNDIIKQTEIQLEEKKQEVIEALKAKTMLDKLKEKDLEAFLKEFERLEMKELDDISISRYKGE
jgi:flagellar export protein FliJ